MSTSITQFFKLVSPDSIGMDTDKPVLEREALELCPPRHSKWSVRPSVCLSRLVIFFGDHYIQLGVITDLTETVVLDKGAPGHPDCTTSIQHHIWSLDGYHTVSGSSLTFGFGGFAVDLQRPGTIMVAALNSWWPDGQIFRSNDSGATWSPLWSWIAYPEVAKWYTYSDSLAPWIGPDYTVSTLGTLQIGWMMEGEILQARKAAMFSSEPCRSLCRSLPFQSLTLWDWRDHLRRLRLD